jgi:uncharacterized circularly permuted ATP-grasp superfamily protein
MIESIGRINMDYMVRLANDPEMAVKELKGINAYCLKHGGTYGGHAIPVPIKPHFISPKQRQLLDIGLRRIHSALERFVELWLADESLQRMWNVTPREMELYKADPGYKNAIQVARFDAFLHDFDLKFLEFNCDSPGGTGYADVIHRGFLEMFDRNGLSKVLGPSARQRLLHLGDTLRDCYVDWRTGRKDRPKSPFIVVSDWREVGTMSDIQITIDYLNEAGMESVFADPRDFENRDDGLYLNGRRVDVVYKRVIVKELVENEDARPLADAYLAGKVCMVNSPRSVIVGNKKILAALHLPEVMDKLSPVQRDAIRKYVPWTEILRDAKVNFHDFKVDLPQFILDNKDKLVLKASQSYGGKDVVLGFEATAEEWKTLMEKHIDGSQWIVQELVTIPKELYPEVRDGKVEMKLLNVNINPLAFGGKYAGSYSRLSIKNVINVSYGGGMTATMTLEPSAE